MSSTAARKAPNEWWVGVIAGMASYVDAAAAVGVGIALVIYQFTIGVTPEQIGVMSGAMTFCVAIGAILGGRLGDRFGRRSVFIVTMVLIAIGSGLVTFSTSYPVLLTGVVLIGFGIGADLPVSLATIAEAASDKNRGKLILLSNTLWVVGIIVAILIATFSGPLGRLGGQLLVGQVGVTAILILIGRITIPESAMWLEARRRRDAGEVDEQPKARVRDLLRSPYLKPFLALMAFYTLTNFGAGTTGAFNTFIAVNYAGATVAEFNQWALGAMLIGMVPGILYMKFVDTNKRMTFFWVGAGLATASYAYIALVGFSLTSMVVSLLLAVVGHSVAFEGMMKVWTQESFPTMLRSTAQGTILSVARVLSAMLITVTPALLQANARGVYAALAIVAGVGFLIGGLTFRGTKVRNQFKAVEERAATTESSMETV